VAAIVFLGFIVVKYVSKQRSDDKERFHGRAVAESVKTLTWRYMMRLGPFEDDGTSDQRFIEELNAVFEARSGLQ
jgi:SMODS and SLOG-associating 2TM effector domain 3